MFYFDYNWDLYKDRIILDKELKTSLLEWKDGDYFKFVIVNGTGQFIKVDPVEIFAKGGKVNGT